jgi:hypothetical protein
MIQVLPGSLGTAFLRPHCGAQYGAAGRISCAALFTCSAGLFSGLNAAGSIGPFFVLK